MPEALAHEVLENGVELSVAIDQFAGAVGIRDAQGAWGVLSSNFITRQEAFRVAVIAAFAPFYNGRMYRAAAVGASKCSFSKGTISMIRAHSRCRSLLTEH